MTDPRKQSLLLPGPLLDELRREADRLGRSRSWVMQQAMQLALPKLRKMSAPVRSEEKAA